ncbi:hypothetical protein [Methylomonas methanica]|uniref:Uncharacterized protein n=1 Tax=Methylomonas methanica (strain DSM 25384 / MC09) TaxID=857087 RepID=G0A5Q2_METMM|nr:hypothetical protein [Methylomonas methanica]AEG02909.1 hypothetical protein Metme_4571 [Methylomonas methanica MC09]
MTPKNRLTSAEIEHLSSLRYINAIDKHMRIVSSVKVPDQAQQQDSAVLLLLDIFIDDKQIDSMSFNLHNYAYDEILDLAQNIRDNDYILRAVDTALSGDIE